MMPGRKRPHELTDWPGYPANTNIDVKPSYDHAVPYAQFLNDDFGSLLYPPTSSNIFQHLFPIPETNLSNLFNPVFQSSGLSIDPSPAYDHTTTPLSFQADPSSHISSPPHYLLDPGPLNYQFLQLYDNDQSLATQKHSHDTKMNSSLQPHRSQAGKSRSIASPSVHGRSVGSEYVIDSPYDYAQGGVMTPGTVQSYELVERPPEIDHSPSGLLAHENDLMGLEINPSLQPTQFEPRTTAEVYSRSPQGIHLDGMDAASGGSTLHFNEYGTYWQSPNADPWVPLPSHRSTGPSPGQLWNTGSNLLPVNDFRFPPEASSLLGTYSSPQHNSTVGVRLETREASHDSTNRTRATSREPADSPHSSYQPSKVKRKPAGKRIGPVDKDKRPGIRQTRKARACWCCKMRKVTCNADKTTECPECQRFWRSKMTGPFLNKEICYRMSLEDLQNLFMPDFMVKHLKNSEVKAFMNDIVEENGWLDRSKTEIHLLCGFGPPLIVKDVQEFRPNGLIQIFRLGRDNPNAPEATNTLPLGISHANMDAEGNALSDLEQHLDRVIDNGDDLNEFADRVLRSSGHSRSGRTLKVVLKWYQDWKDIKDLMSPPSEHLLRNAIKVVMIEAIFGRRLIMKDIPQQFDKFFNEAPYTSRNYSRHKQSPRLINRQVKAALWVLQQRLLSDVLKGFGRELTTADGWPICFAVAIILAFSLEQVQKKSVKFYQLSKACRKLDRNDVQQSVHSVSEYAEVQEYSKVALVRVFDVIHMLLRCKSEKQTLSDKKIAKRIGSMASDLRKVISDLKEEFADQAAEDDQQKQQRLQVGGQDSGRLVSALLELIQ